MGGGRGGGRVYYTADLISVHAREEDKSRSRSTGAEEEEWSRVGSRFRHVEVVEEEEEEEEISPPPPNIYILAC
jgi:hypothetical protein